MLDGAGPDGALPRFGGGRLVGSSNGSSRTPARPWMRATALASRAWPRPVVSSSTRGCIRAVHRRQFEEAETLLHQAGESTRSAQDALAGHPETYHAGFLHDALKEYAEALLTLALVSGRPLPTPASLAVEIPAYLNGLAESAGELRRFAPGLPASRRARSRRGPPRRDDEIYGLLVTLDYPDAITRGLRRQTDMVRSVTSVPAATSRSSPCSRRWRPALSGCRHAWTAPTVPLRCLPRRAEARLPRARPGCSGDRPTIQSGPSRDRPGR